MSTYERKESIQRLIRRDVFEGEADFIHAARNYLLRGEETGGRIEEDIENFGISKEVQSSYLTRFTEELNCWIDIEEYQFLDEGGEANVYFNSKKVIKANDSIYYRTWVDFFDSIILHNLFFPATAYQLIGFIYESDTLKACLSQPYIKMDKPTDLDNVEMFLSTNGFFKSKRNDYYNSEFGIILEDMHDENVLTKEDTLFFIDTVFYLEYATAL